MSLLRRLKTSSRLNALLFAVTLMASLAATTVVSINKASALSPGQTELRLSSATPAPVEAGSGTTMFKVKEVRGLIFNGWTDVNTGLYNATITASVSNGLVSANCGSVWQSTATVVIPAGFHTVEATFCYKSASVGTRNVTVSSNVPRLGQSPISDSLVVPVTVKDTTAPSTPVNGQPRAGTYKTSNVFNYTWDASTDNSDGTISYEYQASRTAPVNGVLASDVWNNVVNHVDASQYPLTSPVLPSVGTADGTWYWQVRAIDPSGNISVWSQIWQYTMDSQGPSVVINSPTQNELFGGLDNTSALQKKTMSVNVTANDVNNLGAYCLKFAGLNNGGCVTGTYVYQPANGSLPTKTIDVSGLASGTYTLIARVTDRAGNATEVSSSVQIDNTLPILSTTVTDGYVSGTQTLDISAVESNPKIYNIRVLNPDYTVTKNKDGTQVTGYYNANNSSNSVTYDWDTTKVNDGMYLIQMSARDAVGNAAVSLFHTVIVDNTAPVVTITGQTTNGTVITPQVTANDVNAPLLYAWTSSSPASSVAISDSSVLEPDFTVNKDGTYTFTLTVTDASGNAATKDFTFTFVTPISQAITGGQGGGLNVPTIASSSILPVFTTSTNRTASTPAQTTTSAVLGETTEDSSNDGKILSTNTGEAAKQVAAVATTKAFLGLGWWWLLIVAGIIGGGYYGYRSRAN